jgi:hypothetical protein
MSKITVCGRDTSEFANIIACLHSRGVDFDAVMECGDWVITLR